MTRAEIPVATVPDLVARWAAETPGQVALRDPRHALTYAQLRAATARGAAALRGAGLGPRDRLALVSENTVTAVVMLLAAQTLGVWPALVNARAPQREMERMIARIAPRLVLFDAEQSAAAAERAAASAARVFDAGAPDRLLALDGEGDAAAAAGSAAQETALLLFTSGTTGAPRAVMHSHRGLLALGQVMTRARLTGAGDQVLGAAPLPHIMGQVNLMAALSAGAELKLQPRASIPEIAEAIACGSMTHLSLVPAAYAQLLQHIRSHGLDLSASRLKYMSSGGAPLDPQLKREIEQLLRAPLANAYGMTESAPGTRSRPGESLSETSIGHPEQGAQVRVMRDGAQACAPGEIGEIWLKSPATMLGYFGDPEETATVLRPGGWVATGDLGRELPNGEFEIVGRRKEMIIRSGFNVYPAEVEAAINRIPGVLQSAVVGRKLPGGDEEVVAFVQPRTGCDLAAEQVDAALREEITPYKRPQRIFVVAAMPTSPNGKILKRELLAVSFGGH